jgi:hypothetical protein
VIANVLRITLTGMAYHDTGSESVQATMHDLAGWLLMPLALGMFWLELRFLAHLLVPAQPAQNKPLALFGALPQPAGGPQMRTLTNKPASPPA